MIKTVKKVATINKHIIKGIKLNGGIKNVKVEPNYLCPESILNIYIKCKNGHMVTITKYGRNNTKSVYYPIPGKRSGIMIYM